jgi:hypothetical protein
MKRALLLLLCCLSSVVYGQKISDLTPLGAAPATNDKITILDVSDTAQAATGSTRSITIANLFTSPTLATPILGVATATSLNGITFTTSTGTFTLTNAKTFAVTNSLTLAGTDGSTLNIGAGGTLGTSAYITLGTGVGTFLTTPTIANLESALSSANVILATEIDTSAELKAIVTDETGTGGALVFADTPTLITPVIGAATGTSLTTTGTLYGYSGTAIPAGGTAGSGFKLSSTANFGIFFGSGVPTLSAAQGSIYLRSDGTPYVNTNGTTGWSLVSAGGSGTVTATGGSLTSNALVLGAGTTDTKVVTGLTSDGTSKLTLGVAGSSVGGLDFKNATSGTINVSPTTGALGTSNLVLPAVSGTIAAAATTTTATQALFGTTTAGAPAYRAIAATDLTGLTGTVDWSGLTSLVTPPLEAGVLGAGLYAADAGANDTYTATLSPAITAYVTGALYRFKANTANTGAASINFNSVGAKTIVKKAVGGVTTDAGR